ncbi:MAG: hypothetical protein OEP52_02300 [Acidimicrobiia bacterium]|nr:hypothetical protein [Acidimicrobiia bacterium]
MLVHQAGMEPTGPLRLILLVTSIALLLLAPTRWLFSRTWHRLEGRRRGRWLLASVVAGGLLALAIPVEHTPLRSVEETVEVVATGDRNPASAGSEVWIFKVTENDRPLDLTDFDLPRSWELKEGALLSPRQSMPAPISWKTEVSRETDLVMLTHPLSGIVEVTRAGATQRIDLYSPTGIVRVIELTPSSQPRLYYVSVLLASSLFLGLMFFGGSVWLILGPRRPTPDLPAGREPSAVAAHGRFGKWEWIALATPPALVWTAYLLAFWPGVMSPDSIVQWTQLRTGSYNDWHPVFHTLTEWVLTRLVESPAIVAATQVAVLSGVVGWGLASMRRLGLPTNAAWVMSGVVALWPANGITVITLWKDIPYAIGVLALGIIMLREIDGRTSLLKKRGGWLLLAGVASAVTLYHHAGVAVGFGSLGALWLSVRRRAVIGAASMTLLTVLVVQVGLYNALDIPETGHPGIDGLMIQHIGAHLDAGTPLTVQDRAEIDELIPIEEPWYNCESINSFVFNPDFSLQAMHERAARARALWWSLFTRNPGADLRHMACSTHLVWRIRHLPGDYQYGTMLTVGPDGAVQTVAANDFGLALDPVLNSLTGPLTDLIVETQQPAVSWLWWRGPLYLYFLLFGAAIAALRAKDRRYWAAVMPAILVATTLAIAAPVQDFRYMYPVVLSGMILGPYLLLAVARVGAAAPTAHRRPKPKRVPGKG